MSCRKRSAAPRAVAWIAFGLSCASVLASAQEPSPPTGPADIMNRAARGRERAEVERAARIAESASAASDAGKAGSAGNAGTTADTGSTDNAGVGGDTGSAASERAREGDAANDPHGGRDPHTVLSEPQLPTAEPNPGSRPGTIEVEVLAPNGAPEAGAEIVLGVMGSMGARTEQRAKADAQGRHVFRDLGVGSQQAYRVNVLYQGAKFSSVPFRLSEEAGYRARVPLRATTSDRSLLFQVIGQTVVELRDDRLHLTQQARLANAGERVIALPKDGRLVPLPAGFTAVQWQDQMTDQKGEEVAGKGFRIRGSLPPGSVTLAWTFDLPREGTSARIPFTQPWRTYTYRVISEAPEGLKLRVSEFPEAERIQDEHRELLFTQIQRRPSEPQLESFTVRIDGIPGPGPGRWVAVMLALAALGYGLSRAFQSADDGSERKAVLKARKSELLELAKATEVELERGEIGPQFRAERLNEIVTELALVLRDEEALAARPAKPAR